MKPQIEFDSDLRVGLSGQLNVTDNNGKSYAPKSAKTCGLLALLCTGDNLQRPRAWLQEMLWSDRLQDQRSASLRQALTDLRRAFGPFADVLIADRQSVSLDPARVQVDKNTCSTNAEFLQGLRVADPAFAIWLNEQRLLRERRGVPTSRAQATQPKGQKRIVLLGETDDGSMYAGLELALRQVVSLSLRETCTVELGSSGAFYLRPDCILVSVKAALWDHGKTRISVSIEDIGASVICWSGSTELTDSNADPFESVPFLALCNQTTEAAMEARVAAHADLMGANDTGAIMNTALRKLFSISANGVAEAIRLFEHAHTITSQPIFHAWRAQAMTIQYVERFVPLEAELREKVDEACRKALEGDHQNSTVLAAVANARTNIEKNYGVGLELALQSVQINPANALAWYAYSNAVQCIGRSEEAYQTAIVAQALAQTTRMKFWTDCQVSIAAATSGRTDVAIRFGERSHALAPGFRPPLRYLTGLYALDARPEDVTRTISALRREEKGFEPLQMMGDPEYPIGIMRRYGNKLTESIKRAVEE